MGWLLLVYWLIGVMLTVRLIGNIAPLQPPWMQREPGLRYALSFLIHAADVADPRRSRSLRRIG
jgi:hypothetical protein